MRAINIPKSFRGTVSSELLSWDSYNSATHREYAGIIAHQDANTVPLPWRENTAEFGAGA